MKKLLTHLVVLTVMLCTFTRFGSADAITVIGTITQSTQDGTGPAIDNPSLNVIQDLQTYTLTLLFPGSVITPGAYDLTGSPLTFSVLAASASETSFDTATLTITEVGGFDQFSLLACLTSGSGCGVGNQLDLNFEIPVGMLNSQNVAATGLDQPHPLDLLEDDGTTDIQGSITTYSGSVSTVPEPSSLVLIGSALSGWIGQRIRRFAKQRR